MEDKLASQIRLCEWSRLTNHNLTAEARRDIYAAVEEWRLINSLPIAPLSFEGPDGSQLRARQYVGVVEVNDVAIEIYPKLDAALIESAEMQTLSSADCIDTVMRNLLWMLEVADHRDLTEAATAHLEETPTSFFDLFAYLLGKNLLPELKRGVAHSYVTFEDDLKTVRGGIGITEQVTRNWNRFDRVFCAWDEFTADIAINRLLKCACRFLAERVNYPEAVRLLQDCQMLLSEVEDVSPVNALRDIGNLRFDRIVERFKTAFDLARRLLAGIGHNLGVGSANTFVFLLDMNQVFERYVQAVLEAHFKPAVIERQKHVGSLFRIHPGGLSQQPDYYWSDGSTFWIADAKYKHYTKGQQLALRFRDLEGENNAMHDSAPSAGEALSPGDIRQLTVYGELVRLREQMEVPPNLVLLYPFVGSADECLPDEVIAWNGSTFWLMPVHVKPQSLVSNAIRFSSLVSAAAKSIS